MLLVYRVKSYLDQLKNSWRIFLLIILFNILCMILLSFLNGSQQNYKNFLKNEGDIFISFYDISSIDLLIDIKKDIENNFDKLSKIDAWTSFFAYIIIESDIKEATVYSINTENFIYKNFKISKGKFPEFNEVLLPDIYQNRCSIGDRIKLRFLNNDNIINSINLKISGFFYSTSENKDLLIINDKTGTFFYGIDFNILSIYCKNDINTEDLLKLNNIIQKNIQNNKNINYLLRTYKTILKDIEKTSFLIIKAIIYIFVMIILILELLLYISYSISILENKLMDYYTFICMGAKNGKIVNIEIYNFAISFLLIFILSYLISFIVTLPFNNITINLKDSLFLSPLFGGTNILTFSFNNFIIIRIYIIFFILSLMINFLVIKNKIKKELVLNLMKYTSNI